MALPIGDIRLSQVMQELGKTSTIRTLKSCFAEANGVFDPSYVGNKTLLSNFQGYSNRSANPYVSQTKGFQPHATNRGPRSLTIDVKEEDAVIFVITNLITGSYGSLKIIDTEGQEYRQISYSNLTVFCTTSKPSNGVRTISTEVINDNGSKFQFCLVSFGNSLTNLFEYQGMYDADFNNGQSDSVRTRLLNANDSKTMVFVIATAPNEPLTIDDGNLIGKTSETDKVLDHVLKAWFSVTSSDDTYEYRTITSDPRTILAANMIYIRPSS
jgi:hypothetical protein